MEMFKYINDKLTSLIPSNGSYNWSQVLQFLPNNVVLVEGKEQIYIISE